MRVLRRFLLLLFIAFVALGLARSGLAAPAAQSGNLLQNPGFEQPFAGGIAQGWSSWYRETPKSDTECLVAYHFRPKWNVETTGNPQNVRDGGASQYVGNNWDTWSAGVYQTVPATPGVTYRFTFYGRGRGTNEPAPAPSEAGLAINMRAGIDPNGSGAWNDADIVWGAAGSPHDQWQAFSVEARAAGDRITVFTSANWAVDGVNQCRQFLDTWYDSAELIALAPPATNTPPPQLTLPTATPGQVATEPAAATLVASITPPVESSPTAAGTPTPEGGGGTVCVNAFLDENGNGLHEAEEGYVAGVTLTVAQGSMLIGQGVSTGTETPICFQGLVPGEYQVAQTVPPTLEMTTQGNTTVQVSGGATVGLEFGSRLRTTPTPAEASPTPETQPTTTTTPETGGSGAPGWLVVVGLGAIVVGIVLLAVLLFTLLRR